MTPLQVVYDAFLARILEDEWSTWEIEEAKQDWRKILDSAITWFKFPRVSLNITGDNFDGELGNEEIQILADFMKCEWLNRCIMTWENVKPMYEERDFSQANLLDKLKAMLEEERLHALYREGIYYRSIKGSPFKYSKLAGK